MLLPENYNQMMMGGTDRFVPKFDALPGTGVEIDYRYDSFYKMEYSGHASWTQDFLHFNHCEAQINKSDKIAKFQDLPREIRLTTWEPLFQPRVITVEHMSRGT